MTTEAGTREMGGSRRRAGRYPVGDEDWQDGVTVAAPRFARVVTHVQGWIPLSSTSGAINYGVFEGDGSYR